MKDNWENVKEPIILDDDTISGMVKAEFGEREVVKSELFGGGLCNSNYKLSIKGMDNPIVLRVYSGSAETCQKETEISKLVQGKVPVPKVYASGII